MRLASICSLGLILLADPSAAPLALSRQSNLQLLSEHGPNAHLMHNHVLEAEAKRLESAVEELKAEVVEINRRRKNEQVRPNRPTWCGQP